MKERHWNSLVTSIRHGQCVLVLGPELPDVNAGDDTGESSLADSLSGELAAELEDDDRRVRRGTLAAVAQQYEDAQGFGPNALRALAGKFYMVPDREPSPVHATLGSLPFTLILTTCQDDQLARAATRSGKQPVVHRYHLHGDKRDHPEITIPQSPQTPLIYHLFGVAAEPNSLVLSENDLLDFLISIVSDRPPLPSSLVRALKRVGQSFLFVGFGIKHWYLRLLLKVLVRALELHRTGSSIATEPLRGLSEADREQTVLFYQRGTRVEVEDADIAEFLSELSARIAAEGGVLESAVPRGPRPRVFVSYAREDHALATAIYDALQKANFEPWMDSESLGGGQLWNDRIEDELSATDFTLVLYSPALSRKTDSYVNKEIELARRRALNVRGGFLIPLRCLELGDDDRISELSEYHEMRLSTDEFEADMAAVISLMRREYQRRHR